MPNIKEIALKHAREYLTFKLGGRKGLDVEEIVCDDEIYKEIVNELAQQFEALIAEIAKQNEPVYQFRPECDNWIDCSPVFFESWRGEKRIVYPLPPTASQIEQETAEAIAKMLDDAEVEETHYCMNTYEEGKKFQFDMVEAIRSGAWKEFKK